jgi:ABC-type antimicrobial peptide transport system permease subunit
VVLGSLLGGGLIVASALEVGEAAGLLTVTAAIIVIVGLLAAVGPARRGLRIQPMEALRTE